MLGMLLEGLLLAVFALLDDSLNVEVSRLVEFLIGVGGLASVHVFHGQELVLLHGVLDRSVRLHLRRLHEELIELLQLLQLFSALLFRGLLLLEPLELGVFILLSVLFDMALELPLHVVIILLVDTADSAVELQRVVLLLRALEHQLLLDLAPVLVVVRVDGQLRHLAQLVQRLVELHLDFFNFPCSQSRLVSYKLFQGLERYKSLILLEALASRAEGLAEALVAAFLAHFLPWALLEGFGEVDVGSCIGSFNFLSEVVL
mmetsp:Transcript_35383/g.54161  ORF Transcript_35383/g.54161 Transcript_35383/m.54161 type:complete len:260 (-) Transcript_35383:1110-1889(-)